MSDHQSVCIELNPSKMTTKDWDDFQSAMDKVAEAHVAEVAKLSYELGVSESCAMDIAYLRTRSRHTPELEAELIELHKKGIPPNMCDFGHQFKSTVE